MSWNTEAQRSGRGLEVMKWLIVAILLIVAIVGSYFFYSDFSLPVRTLVVVSNIAVAVGVAMTTARGKSFILFAREAHIEARKAIWPTRQETFHTTFIVAAVSTVISLILWGLDGVLVRVVSFITAMRF